MPLYNCQTTTSTI